MEDVMFELNELQKVCLTYGFTLLDENENYKPTVEVFKILSNIWDIKKGCKRKFRE